MEKWSFSVKTLSFCNIKKILPEPTGLCDVLREERLRSGKVVLGVEATRDGSGFLKILKLYPIRILLLIILSLNIKSQKLYLDGFQFQKFRPSTLPIAILQSQRTVPNNVGNQNNG